MEDASVHTDYSRQVAVVTPQYIYILYENISGSEVSTDVNNGTRPPGVYYTVNITCLVLQFILILPICLANLLVLRAIHQFERLQTPTNVFIYSLALSDLLVGTVTTPTFALIHHAHLGLEKNQVSCILSYTLAHCPVGVSMTTLFVIAIERFVAIHFPFYHKRFFTRKLAVITAVLAWVYVWVTLPVLSSTTHKWNAEMDDCNFASVLSKSYIIMLLGHMLIIFVVTTVLYLKIACTAHAHHVAIEKQQHVLQTAASFDSMDGSINGSVSFSHNTRLAKMLATVLGIFYLSWLPYFLSLPFAMKVKDEDPLWLHVWEQFAGIAVRCNAFMNPIVYAWKNKEFNYAFRKIMSGQLLDRIFSEPEIELHNGSLLNTKLKSTSTSLTKLTDKTISLSKLTDKTISLTRLTDKTISLTKHADKTIILTKHIDKTLSLTKLTDKTASESLSTEQAMSCPKLTDASMRVQTLGRASTSLLNLKENNVGPT